MWFSLSRATPSNEKQLILDEADTLLDMGFRPDVERISSFLPRSPERQTFLFSATVSRQVEEIAHKTLSRAHAFVNCVSVDDSPVHEHIPQYHTVIPSGDQAFPHLLRLIAHDQLVKSQEGVKSKVVIFFSTTKMVQLFAELMRMNAHTLPHGRNTRLFEMHSKRDMDRRIATSNAFRKDESAGSVLITSDVSARGVDYPGVTRVIQMGLPASKDMYVHRVGRTGRGGKTGGRGDLVMSAWELGFLQRKMQEVKMQPLTVAELESQLQELAPSFSPPRLASPRGARSPPQTQSQPVSYLPKLSTLADEATAATTNVPQETLNDAFMSQLGFYIGHIDQLGLRQQEVVHGLGKFFQDMGAMGSPPVLSRAMEARLLGGGDRRARSGFRGGRNDAGRVSGYGQSQRRPAWGTHATGSDGRGLGRNERERSPWESRGSAGAGGFRQHRDRDSGSGHSSSSPGRGWGSSSGEASRGSGYGKDGRSTPGFGGRGNSRRSFEDY